MKYTDLLVKRIEGKIAKLLPDKFALGFDGCETAKTHFVAIFAPSQAKIAVGIRNNCLDSLYLKMKVSLLKIIIVLFCYALGLYEKSAENVVALIVDSFSTNKALS